MTSPEENIIITAEEAGERLDKILANRFREIRSRTYFQYLIKEQSVLLNGEPVKKQTRPDEGDEIQVEFILTPEIAVEPEPIPLDILYEDEYLLAVNKAPGLVVHPAPGNWTGTFVNALLYHCKDLKSQDDLRPGIVHRLDKDTSGVLLAAKTSETHQRLVALFAGREIKKEYLALCIANPGKGTVDFPIGRHPVHRKQMACVSTGRPARTHYETLATHENVSLVRLDLETGRTHQIRVHMQHLNASVLGDSIYGSEKMNKRYGAKRQMLHAARVKFKHPMTGESLEIVAPIAEDMRSLMQKLEVNL
jgi:23S rRNA pseudouridine1911/1915/1917 synthase